MPHCYKCSICGTDLTPRQRERMEPTNLQEVYDTGAFIYTGEVYDTGAFINTGGHAHTLQIELEEVTQMGFNGRPGLTALFEQFQDLPDEILAAWAHGRMPTQWAKGWAAP